MRLRGVHKVGLASALLLAGWQARAQDPAQPAQDSPQSETPQPVPSQADSQGVSGTVAAQASPAPKASTGAVTGTVYCADNKRPARVAGVVLIPESMDLASQKSAATDLDGKFVISNVPEGKYYVSAQLRGYLNPLAELSAARLAAMSEDERKEFEAHATTVTVTAKGPAEVALELERAAEIDGTVQYDDGSPAIGLHVSVRPRNAAKPKADTSAANGDDLAVSSIASFVGTLEHSTDDHGRFRILGVAPGEYLVSVLVPTGSAGSTPSAPDAPGNPAVTLIQASPSATFPVYSGGELRASTAKPIKIEPGETTADADISIPLSRLHSIEGQVTLKSNGTEPVAATVQLLYADNREVARVALAPDGEFDLAYIPEGDYILVATAGTDPLPKMEISAGNDVETLPDLNAIAASGAAIAAGGAEIPLSVTGDLAGVTIAVPDPPAAVPAAVTADQSPAPSSSAPPQ